MRNVSVINNEIVNTESNVANVLLNLTLTVHPFTRSATSRKEDGLRDCAGSEQSTAYGDFTMQLVAQPQVNIKHSLFGCFYCWTIVDGNMRNRSEIAAMHTCKSPKKPIIIISIRLILFEILHNRPQKLVRTSIFPTEANAISQPINNV